jgi:hypothetical protein
MASTSSSSNCACYPATEEGVSLQEAGMVVAGTAGVAPAPSNGGLSNDDFRTLQRAAEDWATMSKLAIRVTTEPLTTSADAQPAPKNVFYRVGYHLGDFLGRPRSGGSLRPN